MRPKNEMTKTKTSYCKVQNNNSFTQFYVTYLPTYYKIVLQFHSCRHSLSCLAHTLLTLLTLYCMYPRACLLFMPHVN